MKSEKTEIKLALDTDCLELGFSNYVNWNYAKFPHLLLLGNTGSGKSYALRLLVARSS